VPPPPDNPDPGTPPACHPARRGTLAEEVAALYLRLRGMTLLARNVRGGGGEIDLLARDGDALVFVEVRLRGVAAWCGASASVGPRKQRRMRACARWVLHRRRDLLWAGCRYRFDVVALDLRGDELHLSHLRGVRLEG
jgi:putative endonuclease